MANDDTSVSTDPTSPSPSHDAQSRSFVESLLNNVSRSFALAIPMLEEPLDQQVGIAYLLCRVCDNIEDCAQPPDWKSSRFDEFEVLLSEPKEGLSILKRWGSLRWPGLTPLEQEMMTPEVGGRLWALFAGLSAPVRAPIRRWALEMARGMERTLLETPGDAMVQREGVILSRDMDAFNRYCHYVAGTVGFMCTELAGLHYGLDMTTLGLLEQRADAFGRGLQKINILKDFKEDLQRHVSYFPLSVMEEAACKPLALEGADLPWVMARLFDIWSELEQGMDYVMELPEAARGYRRFCLSAILPAVETWFEGVRLARRLFTADHELKISREVMFETLELAGTLALSNQEFANYRQQLKGRVAGE